MKILKKGGELYYYEPNASSTPQDINTGFGYENNDTNTGFGYENNDINLNKKNTFFSSTYIGLVIFLIIICILIYINNGITIGGKRIKKKNKILHKRKKKYGGSMEWFTILCIICTIIVIGGTIYWWLGRKDSNKQTIFDQINPRVRESSLNVQDQYASMKASHYLDNIYNK